MASTAGRDDGVGVFMDEVARICKVDPWVSTLGAGILAAISLEIARDSRAFAKAFGIEHALVLREVQTLVELDRLIVTKRDERTQRCSYEVEPLVLQSLRAVNDRV